MNIFDLFRRTAGFAVFGILTWLAASHDWLGGVFSSAGKVIALIGVALAVAVLIVAILRPSSLLTIATFLIGIGAYWWAANEFSTRTSLGLGAAIIVIVSLWAVTVLDVHTVNAATNKRSRSSQV